MKLLNEIQQKLKAPKGQFNSFGKYKYRSCEDILEAIKPLLGDGVLTLTDEMVLIGDRYYVKAFAQLTNGEEKITVSAYARESLVKKGMDESQITGTASSYARKYALNGLFCIDDTKDADTMDNAKEGTTKPQTKIKKPTATEQEVLDAICDEIKCPDGMEVDRNKVSAICYAAKSKYPTDIKTAGAVAGYLESHNSKEIFVPKPERKECRFFCKECDWEYDDLNGSDVCPKCLSNESVTDREKGAK